MEKVTGKKMDIKKNTQKYFITNLYEKTSGVVRGRGQYMTS